jgi:predicted DNA-binding WGR domain protein
MFSREYWHPKTTPAAALAVFAERLSVTIRFDVNTLQSAPSLQAGGRLDHLEKYRLSGKRLPPLPDEAAIFAHLDTVFEKLAADDWVETEESLSYRVFVNRNTGVGKFWNILLTGNTCEIHFGKAEDKRGRLVRNSGHCTEKELPTRAEALAAYDKMIHEKLAKGYVELHPR